LGSIVKNKEDADYYIISTIKESINLIFVGNYSLINLDVFTNQDIPIFHVRVKVTSNRDDNFYYHQQQLQDHQII